MITLTVGSTVYQLGADLLWTDEYSWSPVAQSRQVSLGSSLIVQTMTAAAGRPMTLEGGDRFGWIKRALVDQLFGLVAADQAGVLQLNDGRSFNVQWLQPDGNNVGQASSSPPFKATPVVDLSDPSDDDNYIPTLRFYQV